MALLSSLTNRIFFASALLAIVAMAIAIFAVNVRVTREVEADLQRGLVQAGTLVDQQHSARVEALVVMAHLVADLPKLKAAVTTGDPPTVEPLAREYRAELRSDLLVVSDRTGSLLATIGMVAPSAEGDRAAAVREAMAGRTTAMFWPHPAGILEVVTVPIAVGPAAADILGALSVGVLLNDRLANEFKAATESEIAFAVGGAIKAATFPPGVRELLSAAIGQPGVSRLQVAGAEYVALARPLVVSRSDGVTTVAEMTPNPSGSQAAAGPVVVILRSRTERLRLLSSLQAALGVTALVAILLATVLSYGVARTVTRPLATITAGMREVAATGDLARKIDLPSGRWVDEDARLLAATFNGLTDSVARFQREAAQRERLSALGRLSTVIAHEIRNPLMIIKAALRPLRGGTATPDQIRESVGDVEQEVGRLNRIVSDVLDFARPVRFELAEADLNRVAADAAAAAAAGDQGARIALRLDPDLPRVVTDSERLRAVLVNLLMNARQAVRAKQEAGSGGDPAPDRVGADARITLTTSRAGLTRVVTTVRDEGIGIAADDLAHVFDPFFTTRRGGTGLGLPISKNVIEGLGGTISMRSQPGEGTEVRIELPITAS